MASHRWIKNEIAQRAQEDGLYVGRGWAPGEGAVESELQQVLFDAIDPSHIGLTLVGESQMRPIMSITGFMGVSSDQAIETDGADRSSVH